MNKEKINYLKIPIELIEECRKLKDNIIFANGIEDIKYYNKKYFEFDKKLVRVS